MMGSTGGMYLWLVLWIVVGLALAVTAGLVVARALSHRRHNEIGPAESRKAQDAQDALRLRYARGEISREEYLQGKVELED